MLRPQQKKQLSRRKKILIIIASILVLAAGVLAVLERTGTTDLIKLRKPPTPVTASPDIKGEPQNGQPGSTDKGTANNGNNNGTPPSQDGTYPSDNKTPTSNDLPLAAPTGNFVSNHRPNLGGNPAPNTMQSSCNTTAGATCQIFFTKDGITKSLAVQKVDAGGGTYWNWKLQDVGLTTGTWKVYAEAKNGSKTLKSDDPIPLEVQP